MINEKGARVAGPKVPDIPPHMLEAMTSAAQKKVLRDAARAEKKGAAPARVAKKAAAKKSSARKRAAKKAAVVTPVEETKA